MTPRSTLRTLSAFLCIFGVPTMILGCPKKPVAEVDSGAPVAVEIDAAPTLLAPLDEVDAGADTGPDAAVKKHGGTGLNTNQTRAKQCCTALRTQAKALGNSPEAQQLIGVAAMCDSVAVQVGPTAGGNAPELAPLRAMLAGKTVPPICQGL